MLGTDSVVDGGYGRVSTPDTRRKLRAENVLVGGRRPQSMAARTFCGDTRCPELLAGLQRVQFGRVRRRAWVQRSGTDGRCSPKWRNA
jgi:hypothetical protein